MSTTWKTRAISPKQEALIVNLAAEKHTGDPETAGTALLWERMMDVLGNQGSDDPKFVSQGEASAVIDWLFQCPRATADGQPEKKAEAGYYIEGDDVFVVVISKSSGQPYAKVLEIRQTGSGKSASWQYAPGVAKNLAQMAPLTVEEAARLGHKHGFCVVCGTQLTDNHTKGPDGLTSSERGIGPTCFKNLRKAEAERLGA